MKTRRKVHVPLQTKIWPHIRHTHYTHAAATHQFHQIPTFAVGPSYIYGPHSITDTNINTHFWLLCLYTYRKNDSYVRECLTIHVLTFCCALSGVRSWCWFSVHHVTHCRQPQAITFSEIFSDQFQILRCKFPGGRPPRIQHHITSKCDPRHSQNNRHPLQNQCHRRNTKRHKHSVHCIVSDYVKRFNTMISTGFSYVLSQRH